jgi:hypothetical protein
MGKYHAGRDGYGAGEVMQAGAHLVVCEMRPLIHFRHVPRPAAALLRLLARFLDGYVSPLV